jgi:hypothetical protein
MQDNLIVNHNLQLIQKARKGEHFPPMHDNLSHQKIKGPGMASSLSVAASLNSLKDTKLHFYKSPLERKKKEDDEMLAKMQRKVPPLNGGLTIGGVQPLRPPRAPLTQQPPMSASHNTRNLNENNRALGPIAV